MTSGLPGLTAAQTLAVYTTLRLGGPAMDLVEARDRDEIVAAVRATAAAGRQSLLLAGGSNVVIGDAGFAGTVVLVRSAGIRLVPQADDRVLLIIEAGQEWDAVVRYALQAGLAGLECMSGIPGSAGATPIQNVGAYGHEVAEVLHSVTVYDRELDEVRTLTASACRLGLRTSIFKRSDRYAVLAITLELARSELAAPVQYAELARVLGVELGARVPAMRVREAVLGLRAGKGMVLDPNDPDTCSVGSFFENPVLDPDGYARLVELASAAVGQAPPSWPYQSRTKVSAAWLIERAGFTRGYLGADGRVGISTKHTLALTNRGGGTSDALIGLAREIRAGVLGTFGVTLEPEAVLIGCAL